MTENQMGLQMSVVDTAMDEMRRADFPDSDKRVVRAILELFLKQWNSGGAVWVMVPVINRCLSGLPLTPLTGDDDEWVEVTNGLRQNVRCGTVFSEDGRCYDIDDSEWSGSFPYYPTKKNLDPAITICKTEV